MTEKDRPGVIAPPPLIYLAALGLGFLLDALLPSGSVPDALRWTLGPALVLAGIALQASFVVAFVRAKTNVDPYKPTKTIVTTGPYRLTRNPGYLGFTLFVAGIAVLAEALWIFAALALAVLVMDRGVIAREERYLERKFGEQYLSYKRSARRWI
jgi:protein-S-isoprenylcysteine O-methyltransferase Ste14